MAVDDSFFQNPDDREAKNPNRRHWSIDRRVVSSACYRLTFAWGVFKSIKKLITNRFVGITGITSLPVVACGGFDYELASFPKLLWPRPYRPLTHYIHLVPPWHLQC